MGNNKQPLNLLLAKGKKHLTKAEIEERKAKEIKADCDEVVAPDYFSDEQKAKFDHITNELKKIGIVANLDSDTLARYVVASSQYDSITIQLLKTKTISKKYIELTNLQEKYFKMCRALGNDLGLSITSRCKLSLPKTDKEEKPKNKFSKFA